MEADLVISEKTKKRFWAKVYKSGLDACWLWTASLQGGRGSKGVKYGGLWVPEAGRRISAHIVSWLIHKGPTLNLWVLHKCDEGKCVNPQHLFLGTRMDNIRDCVSKLRHVHGQRHPESKLTEGDVSKIRSMYPVKTLKELSEEFHVGTMTICNIVHGRAWKHVGGPTVQEDMRHRTSGSWVRNERPII